ncbi:MAG: hypothetical protein ABMA14_19070 [Hyphomonadaceae bacterium]
MVGHPAPPRGARSRVGLYWIYAGLLATASIFYLAVVSPIIRPTLPTHPEHLLFCIFAGIAIGDAAAHAISDIASIWKPHDLGGAQSRKQKFSARKLLASDIQSLASHLSAVPVIALMAFAYTLLSPHMQDKLFGVAVGQGAVIWNFVSQSILGGLELFAFFLSHEARSTLRDTLHLTELEPASVEAAAILAGLKLYGLLVIVATLRLLGAPIVLFRTWRQSRKTQRKAAKGKPAQ